MSNCVNDENKTESAIVSSGGTSGDAWRYRKNKGDYRSIQGNNLNIDALIEHLNNKVSNHVDWCKWAKEGSNLVLVKDNDVEGYPNFDSELEIEEEMTNDIIEPETRNQKPIFIWCFVIALLAGAGAIGYKTYKKKK